MRCWFLCTALLSILLAPAVVAAQPPVPAGEMCGDGTSFDVPLFGLIGSLPFGHDAPPDVVRLPMGCDIYAFFVSGYSAEMAGRTLELRDGENFVQKPCAPDHLLETVRQFAPEAAVAEFEYRSTRPLYAGTRCRLNAKLDEPSNGLKLWAQNADEKIVQAASMKLATSGRQ